jgi:Ion channel
MILSPSIGTSGFSRDFLYNLIDVPFVGRRQTGFDKLARADSESDSMNKSLSLALGLLLWIVVMWDGFSTIVLPRTVAPMKRISGRFYKRSWQFWSLIGRGIRTNERRLSFLAVYGPLSVMLLLVIWASLAVLAFALIYQGSGSRFEENNLPVSFGTLLYMSGSTFLTLGIGDVTSIDSLGRTFMILEAATGFVFLGLIITYMPLLDQAYASREVGGLLLQSRAGKPPSAVRLLRRYSGPDGAAILRGNLREGEQWMADILQSHLSHPVLCFYRAQHYGQSWLVSLTTIMDTSALLIVGGEGRLREQARLTFRMGLLLLIDLTSALGLSVPTRVDMRLTETDLPALRSALSAAGVALKLGPTEGSELLRINRRYGVYLQVMSRWLMITLPPWIPPAEELPAGEGLEYTQAWNPVDPGIAESAD